MTRRQVFSNFLLFLYLAILVAHLLDGVRDVLPARLLRRGHHARLSRLLLDQGRLPALPLPSAHQRRFAHLRQVCRDGYSHVGADRPELHEQEGRLEATESIQIHRSFLFVF